MTGGVTLAMRALTTLLVLTLAACGTEAGSSAEDTQGDSGASYGVLDGESVFGHGDAVTNTDAPPTESDSEIASDPGPGDATQCGDGVCSNEESSATCPADCEATCGDGVCAVGENADLCPEDCPLSCGDGVCAEGETALNCSADCGQPCGDGTCSDEETAASCPEDCGPVCGDGLCEADESTEDCPEDCVSDTPELTGIFAPQREAWRAEGLVSVEGNRLMVGGEAYYPKTDFLTAVYPGDDWSTWSSLYYFGFDEAKRHTVRDALVEAQYNSIYIFTLNIGDGVITPYGQGGFSADTGDLNTARVEDWKAAVEDLLDHQLKPFIWLAGDDSPAVAAMSLQDWQTYVDHMVDAFEEYPILWVIGLEVDEYWTPTQSEQRRAYLASKTQHPVGVHLTISETTNTATPYQHNFDFVMGQFHSPQDNAAYASQTAAYTLPDVPWIASEFNVFGTGDGDEAVGSVTERSRDIGTVIAAVGDPPLVAGIGNGIDLTGEPPAPPEGPPEDFSGVIWLHTDVSGWAQTATLSQVSIQGGQVCMDYDKANQWPVTTIQGSSGEVEVVGNPWVFIKHEGQWYAATWEWLRPGQTCKDKNSVAGDHIKQSPFVELDWTPTPGQTYWLMVSAPARMGQMTVAERSNLLPLVWSGSGGSNNGGEDPPTNPVDVPPPSSSGEVLGHIDSVVPQGSGAVVNGWACHQGWPGAINVHLYVGGSAGVGTLVTDATADEASEAAVASACGSTGTAHRFAISMTPEQRSAHAGQPVYVHGISPVGKDNLLLENSGTHTVPAP